MRLAGGPENFFKSLDAEARAPFRAIDPSGIRLPGMAPRMGTGIGRMVAAGMGVAAGAGAVGVLARSRGKGDEKRLRKIIRQETRKAIKSRQPKGFSFDLT